MIITDMSNDDLIDVYIVQFNIYILKHLNLTTKLYIINNPDNILQFNIYLLKH